MRRDQPDSVVHGWTRDVLGEDRTRVENLRSLFGIADSERRTEQTAYDLAAIRRALEMAERELKREMEKIARDLRPAS